MLRKHILTERPAVPAPRPGEKDIAAVATVLVTSEAADHPIDSVFDSSRGAGGSCWIGGEPGEQTLILAFDTPQTIRTISLEVEDPPPQLLQTGRPEALAPRNRCVSILAHLDPHVQTA